LLEPPQRLPGADVQPHFALSAIVALGMHGIKNKLEIPNSPVTLKDAQDAKAIKLPKNLKDATERMMAKDSFARKVLGDDFVDHFGATRMHEWRLFEQAVTDYEVERYLELA
jgi:glutamine synthetase